MLCLLMVLALVAGCAPSADNTDGKDNGESPSASEDSTAGNEEKKVNTSMQLYYML